MQGYFQSPKMDAAKCTSIDEWIKPIMGHLHNAILLGCKKENFTLCNSIDGPGEYYAK